MLAVAAILHGPSVLAQQTPAEAHDDHAHGAGHENHILEEIVVRATPLDRDVLEISQSATVLTGEDLRREASNNIGDTLGRQAGLANASFGQNIGRPVIRGQQGPRVRVLENRIGSLDVSDLSPDHAVGIEPMLAESVEVLRGPSTLLYGGGAIGGSEEQQQRDTYETQPSGNAVVLEEQLLMANDTVGDHRMMTNLYQKNLNLLRIALGRQEK